MMAVVADFFILTAQVFGHILYALIQWMKKPREKLVHDEICLITGAANTNGIGRLFALEFARRGAVLVLWDIDAKGNESTAREVRKLGAKAYTYTCDVSQREVVYGVAACVRREVGEVNILVNNAGVVSGKPFLQCPDEELEKTMRTNCHAHFWTVKAFLPQMIKRGRGHIVTVAGWLGLFAAGCLEDYCASQFAVVGFHEALSHELKAKKINSVKTTLVCPYFVNTGMFHGCGIRRELESLLSPLKPDNFVKTAVQGILCNQHMISVPRVIYFAAISKNLLPWNVQVLIQNFLGLDKCIPQKANCQHSAAGS